MLPPAIGPVGQTLEGHDLILVAGCSVFPYYPHIPGPLLPEGSKLVAITSDPDEAARAPMGDAIVADVGLTLEALLEAGRPSPRARAPEPQPAARRKSRRATRSTPRPSTPPSARSCPRTRSSSSSRPSSTLALRNQLRLSRPGSYYFSAGGGLGFGLAASVGVQLAQPDRPVVCVLGEGSAQYAITAFWSAVAYEIPVTFLVLRNSEYAILKWFADARAGERRARRSTCRRSTSRAIAAGYGVDDRPWRATATRSARRSPPRSPPRGRSWSRSRSSRACRSSRRDEPVADRALAARRAGADRAPDALAAGTPQPLRGELEALLGADRVLAHARSTSSATPPTPAPTGCCRRPS